MADIKWIKLKTSMFNDDKIKLIQAMPEGDSIIVIWIRMLILAGVSNAEGYLMISDNLPYTEEMLATVFNKPLATIRLAIKTFEMFGMVEANNDGIYIPNFSENQSEKLQDIREYNRQKKAESRERAKQKRIEMSNQEEVDSQDNVNDKSRTSHGKMSTCQEIDIDIDKDIREKEISSEEEIKKKSVPPAKEQIAYQKIVDDFNTSCKELPQIHALSAERKRKIQTLMASMDKEKILLEKSIYERLHHIFRLTHESDFLSGRNGHWTKCSFDWLINKTNALKILKGAYANRTGKNNAFCNFPQREYAKDNMDAMERQFLGC